MSFLTPLRYPGGKGRLGPWIAEFMRHNRISGGWYAEPYAGGAGAALYLLMRGYVNHIVINDADPIVHSFWKCAINSTEELIKKINSTPVTMESWKEQQHILTNTNAFSEIDVAFATFFLNRTNRSGIISAGVIGGKNQTGPYKIDARYNKSDLTQRIEKIGSMRNHISLHGLDALDLIEVLEKELPDESLIYLDPPYFNKGSQLYRNHYKPDDHSKISDAVKSIKKPWIVSYDNCTEIRELYSWAKSAEFSLYYSTHLSRNTATEVMFYGNSELHAPPYMRR